MNLQCIADNEQQLEFALEENSSLPLRNAKGCLVRCMSGVLLITAYDELADIELRPDNVFEVPNNGLALVEAIGDCRVQLDLRRLEPHPMYRMFPISSVARLKHGLFAPS